MDLVEVADALGWYVDIFMWYYFRTTGMQYKIEEVLMKFHEGIWVIRSGREAYI